MTLPLITSEGVSTVQIRRAFERLNQVVIRPLSIVQQNIVIDDHSGEALVLGARQAWRFAYDCRIVVAALMADQVGSIEVDLWLDVWGNYPPTAPDSICGGNNLVIVAANRVEDADLVGWSPRIPAGAVLVPSVIGCTTVQRVTLYLKLDRE